MELLALALKSAVLSGYVRGNLRSCTKSFPQPADASTKDCLSMSDLLASIEASSFATWLRLSPSIWAYPFVLTMHTVGLAMLVGANWVLDLRLLGFAPQIPLSALTPAFPIMWAGFWINTVSGAMLFAADATTKGATRLFVAKLGVVAAGVVVIVLIRRTVYGRGAGHPSSGPAAKALAFASIVLWVVAIAAGRLMAYL
jgi:hypothetical protein